MKSSGIGFIWYILVFLLVFMLCINFIRLCTGGEIIKSMSLINTLKDLDFSVESFRNLFSSNIIFPQVDWTGMENATELEKTMHVFNYFFSNIRDLFNAFFTLINDIIHLIKSFFAILFGYAL